MTVNALAGWEVKGRRESDEREEAVARESGGDGKQDEGPGPGHHTCQASVLPVTALASKSRQLQGTKKHLIGFED